MGNLFHGNRLKKNPDSPKTQNDYRRQIQRIKSYWRNNPHRDTLKILDEPCIYGKQPPL